MHALKLSDTAHWSETYNKTQGSYMRGGYGNSYLWNWRPAFKESHQHVQEAYTLAASRVDDAEHNSGFFSGLIKTLVASTVGKGLRLASKMDYQALNLQEEAANALSSRIERAWELYTKSPIECDAKGKQTFGQIQQSAFKSYLRTGEVFGLLVVINRPYCKHFTKVQLLSPTRLSLYSDQFNWISGIKIDQWGMPLAYRVSNASLAQSQYNGLDIEINAKDNDGKTQVLHFCDNDVGQLRGISPFTAVLEQFRKQDKLSDSYVQTAHMQTLFAASLFADGPSDQALEGLKVTDDVGKTTHGYDAFLNERSNWYKKGQGISFDQPARINHLAPGDRLEFHGTQVPAPNFDIFNQWLLREIAACAGVTYETISLDYRNATYSSVRMATAVMWDIVLQRRSNICEPFCQSVFEAWLEERVILGAIEGLGDHEWFLNNRSAICRAEWRGPAKPQADDFKTARASAERLQAGTSTLEQETADLGADWEENLQQRTFEIKKYEEAGLSNPFMINTKTTLPIEQPTEGE